MDNPTYCEDLVRPLTEFFLFKFVLGFHSFWCIVAIILSIYTIKIYWKAYFHINCKILVITLLFFYIVHGVSLSTGLIYHIIVFSHPPNGCSAMVSALGCLALRGPANFCLFLFSPLHFVLSLERIVAWRFGRMYEQKGAGFGIAFLVFSFTVSLTIFGYIMSFEHWDSSGWVPYCTIGNKWTNPWATLWMQIFIGFDLFSIGIMIFSYHKGISHPKRDRSFDVTIRFAAMERRETNALLLPFSIMHGAFYIIYEIGYLVGSKILVYLLPDIVFRTAFAALNTIPYYTILSNLMLIILFNRMYHAKRRKWNHNVKMTTTKNEKFIHSSYSHGW